MLLRISPLIVLRFFPVLLPGLCRSTEDAGKGARIRRLTNTGPGGKTPVFPAGRCRPVRKGGFMSNMEMKKRSFEWHLPGQRIIKTGIAVTLCLLFYTLLGYRRGTMPAESAITAIICVQPYMHDTAESGVSRLEGTMIGAVWGFLFLLLMYLFPALGNSSFLLYPLMGIGTLLTLHSAVQLRRPDESALAAIVFICVVIAYPDIENPLDQAFLRILQVLLGAVIATLVNSFRLPRAKQEHMVFFLPMSQLTDSLLTRLPSAVLFRLQKLLSDGAKICLVSRHAPAFQTSQLGSVKFNVPMIVMDGAAIYDPNENVYVKTANLQPASCRWLMKRLENQSFFIYTVHRDRNCIYHHGELTELERTVYNHLKRSPYRYYLDDDHFSLSDVVYIKLVTTAGQADRLRRELEPMLEKMKLRSVIRAQAGLTEAEGCSLYFYAADADIEHAQAHLMQLLRQNDPELQMHWFSDERAYLSEKGAVKLLQRVAAEYEPLLLPECLYNRIRRPIFLRGKQVRSFRRG